MSAILIRAVTEVEDDETTIMKTVKSLIHV